MLKDSERISIEFEGKFWKLPNVSIERKETSGGFLKGLDL